MSEDVPVESPVRYGYQIVLREDGTFGFEVLGDHTGAIELLGIHEYAKVQIDNLIAPSVGSSSVALLQNSKVLYEMLKAINARLDQVINGKETEAG